MRGKFPPWQPILPVFTILYVFMRLLTHIGFQRSLDEDLTLLKEPSKVHLLWSQGTFVHR